MAFVRKLSLGGSGFHTISGSASTYIGDINDIWADDVDFNTLRRGDGTTPGGIPIGNSGAHFSGQWADVIAKPTTVSGFGITDAVTPSSTDTFTNKSGNISLWLNDSGYLTSVPAQSFASLTGKPTTIVGYGITDTFFDGAYASLSGLPTIPTNNNQLTNGAGFITSYIDTTYTAGSGLTLTGTVFSNTSPDQTVALTGTGATSISGTYPNFTINSTDTNTTYVAGSGLLLSGNSFANTAPDQTVVLTGTGATSITGTYPNFTINSTDTNTTYVNSDWNHDNLTGFVANEHIDWITASAGTIHPSNYTDTDTIYTTFNTDFDTRLATKTTADLSELTNKYFTDDRARQAISATGDVSYNSTTGVISYTAPTNTAEQDFSIHTAVFNATAGSRHAVDTSSTAVTATLPASPATGDAIFFADAGGNYATNNLIIGRNGNTIMGSATDMTVSSNNQSVGLFYNGTTWRIY
jgi:hypothetical protein